METFIGVLAGGLITFLTSRWYYLKASEDLRQEAGNLKRYNVVMIRMLEEAGYAKANWDEEGNPVGVRLFRTSTSHVEPIGGEAHVETRRAETEPPADGEEER